MIKRGCYGEESRHPGLSAVTNLTKSSAVAEKVRDAARYLENVVTLKHRSCPVVNTLSLYALYEICYCFLFRP